MKSSSALKNHKNENRPVDGTYVLWLAFDGDKIIRTSGMSFAESRRTSCALRGELVSCPACIPEILWSIVFYYEYEYKEDY